MAWQGLARRGGQSSGSDGLGQARQVLMRNPDEAWLLRREPFADWSGEVRRGWVSSGEAWIGAAGRGTAWRGLTRRGLAG